MKTLARVYLIFHSISIGSTSYTEEEIWNTKAFSINDDYAISLKSDKGFQVVRYANEEILEGTKLFFIARQK